MPIVNEIRGQNNYFHSQSLFAYSKDVHSTEMSELDLLRAGLHSRLLPLARLLGQRNTLNKLQGNAVIVKHADHSRSKLLRRSWRCYDLECSPAPL